LRTDENPLIRNNWATLGREIKNPIHERGSLNVRFAPKATELLRRRKITRCAASVTSFSGTLRKEVLNLAIEHRRPKRCLDVSMSV
jgi:hypothetical protein